MRILCSCGYVYDGSFCFGYSHCPTCGLMIRPDDVKPYLDGVIVTE